MNEKLLVLLDTRDVLQKQRIKFGNQKQAVEDGRDDTGGEYYKMVTHYFEEFSILERSVDEDIREIVETMPIYEVMSRVKGIGPMMVARLVAHIDITVPDSVSGLWRYSGYGVRDEDGKADRPVKGQKLGYNKHLKTVCHIVAMQLLKSRSPYADIYYEAKNMYEQREPDWNKMHVHLAARRKMIKIFLAHLWEVWRNLEGLSVRPPYAQAKLGHEDGYISPADYGWYEEEEKEEDKDGTDAV